MIRLVVLTIVMLAAASLSSRSQPNQLLTTEEAQVVVETVARGLDHPWGLAFLPDGRMLVTQQPGRLTIVSVDGRVSPPLAGTPRVHGGLMDVALDPAFSENHLVYLTYVAPCAGGWATAAGRGRLNTAATALDDFHVIFQQQPASPIQDHFGSRLAFTPDGKLFISMGDRDEPDRAQDLATDIGKLIRINPDGSVPPNNPFVRHAEGRPEIWSYGHRNIQGLAVHSDTGALWAGEFGPTGGDEINIPEPDCNYGWPLVSWGDHKDGRPIPRPTTRPDLADAIYHWTPSVSFSGMTFYTGSALPAWRGNLLLAGLASQALIRLTLAGSRVTGEERIPMGERIRHVAQGPDGLLYLLTDENEGRILRVSPAH
ncbi:PQQ-dependent sugar dehydrogenase [Methylobacterium frigidaeris]|uniref:Aldose sugar dehydrogenase YliI n=1 Tax=Methylobacterium frigidaeris TaxID=2038277 RepID=A0AA37HH22_9HYPH|nr:PQQ-dependent sugar dehydrogenase [Methylobacterium frigidaeris]GJD65627.1 Aldose sugar dehydrogenase YliI [Methylobacterium frigidaeris]